MGELINTPDEIKQATAIYDPSPLESLAAEKIKKRFEDSSRFWADKHKLQKRLWARYLNAKLQDKDPNFSNIQLGRTWYICDIIESVLGEFLLNQRPFGRIRGQGIEDFPGAQSINKVNGWQQEARHIKTAKRDSLLHSIVTGTGVHIPGWEYHLVSYFDKVEQTLKMMNPADPSTPIEIPTGQYQTVKRRQIIDQLSCVQINEWMTFPPAGGTSPAKDPYFMFLVKYNKSQLKELESTGYIKNVDFIDQAAYGTHKDDEDVSDYFIDRAKKENTFRELDQDTIWVVYYFGLFAYSDDGSVPPEGTAEEPCFIIKAKYCDTVLKFERNPYPAIPCVRDRYSGTDEEWYGRSFMEIIEQILKLDEDMFGYAQTAATRELFRRTFVSDSTDQSALAKWHPDAIVAIPDAQFSAGKLPITEEQRPQMMVNLQEQRRISSEIIDEISSVLDFVRGGDIDEQEKATMTTARVNFLNKRLKNRMQFYEDHSLQEWMEWQVVLNHNYLSDKTVENLTEIPAWLNPFKMIEPVIPLRNFDFLFEGAMKAAENPVQAQIYRNMLDVAANIQPGFDEKGQLVQVNQMALFRQFVKKTAPDEDIDEFFMPAIGAGMGMPGSAGAPGGLGAVRPGDLMGKTGMPGANAGIRQETR